MSEQTEEPYRRYLKGTAGWSWTHGLHRHGRPMTPRDVRQMASELDHAIQMLTINSKNELIREGTYRHLLNAAHLENFEDTGLAVDSAIAEVVRQCLREQSPMPEDLAKCVEQELQRMARSHENLLKAPSAELLAKLDQVYRTR